MHVCLQIPQIVVLILEHIQSDQPALAKLARTCKSFSDPALDALWYSQPSLFNLLKCFPEHIWGLRSKRSKVLSTLFLRHTPEAEDYERVNFYASRIRILGENLYCHLNSRNKVEDVVYSALLSLQSTTRPFLPRLQSLIIAITDFDVQAIYPRFVTGPLVLPNLRSVCLVGDCYSPGSTDFLDEYWDNVTAVLAVHLPQLQVFKIEEISLESYERWDVMHCIRSLFCAFQSLRTLDISFVTLTPDVLAHLATIDTLKTLVFAALSKDLEASAFLPSLSGAYSGLQSLGIYTDESRGCAMFLSHLDLLGLHKLTISHSEEGEWYLDEIISNLKLMTPSLRTLNLWKYKNPEDVEIYTPLPPLPFTSSMLNSLLCIPTLTHLDITLDLSLELNNDDLRKIAITWPNLRYLSLPDNRLSAAAGLTFEGLFPLIENCPDLETLIIRVDIKRDFIPDFSRSGCLGSLKHMKHLDFCTSPLWPYVEGLVPIIPLLFPRLESLNVSEEYRWFDPDWHEWPPREIKNRRAWRDVISKLRPMVPSASVEFRYK